MKISVVIPTRNEASTIEGAIRQYQPFFEKYDLEIIVSDGHSSDGTVQIVRRWAEKYPDRVRLVQKPGKQNIAIGRNAGAEAAQGELIFSTDADVRIPRIERFFETVFEKFSNPRLAAATAPLQIYPSDSTLNDRVFHWLNNTIIRSSILVGWCLSKGECQVFRRSAFEQVGGFDEKIVVGEDGNLFFRLQKAGKVAFLRQLRVFHSPRRFRQDGYLKVNFQYLVEGFSLYLLGQSFAKEWTVVR